MFIYRQKEIKVEHWLTGINEKEIDMFMIQKKKLVIHGDYKTGAKYFGPKYF